MQGWTRQFLETIPNSRGAAHSASCSYCHWKGTSWSVLHKAFHEGHFTGHSHQLGHYCVFCLTHTVTQATEVAIVTSFPSLSSFPSLLTHIKKKGRVTKLMYKPWPPRGRSWLAAPVRALALQLRRNYWRWRRAEWDAGCFSLLKKLWETFKVHSHLVKKITSFSTTYGYQ